MNKLRAFTEIALTLMGLYFTARILPQAASALFLFLRRPSLESAGIWVAQWSITGFSLVVLYYFCWARRERIAKRMVGTTELPASDAPVGWLPTAFRLVSVAAGLYCLWSLLWQIAFYLNRLALSRSLQNTTSPTVAVGEIAVWVVLLVLGLYLCCGAPHFVRWQVKKTMEQCRQYSDSV